jgi:YHS domain-containing protein
MLKQIKCPECNCIKKTQRICDTCGCDDMKEGKYRGLPIDVEFGYGSILDGNNYCFCTLQCLKKFVDAEIEKENT